MDGFLHQTDTFSSLPRPHFAQVSGTGNQGISIRNEQQHSLARLATHIVRKEIEIQSALGIHHSQWFSSSLYFSLRYLQGTVMYVSKAIDLQQQKDEQPH